LRPIISDSLYSPSGTKPSFGQNLKYSIPLNDNSIPQENIHQRHLLSIILLFKITVEEMNKDLNRTHKSAQEKDTTTPTKQQ